MRKKLSFEAKIGLMAASISVMALGISAYQAYMQRLQTYASAMPSLAVFTSSNYNSIKAQGNSFELILVNKGVGPAKIDSVLYEYKGQKFVYFQEVVQKIINKADFGTNEPWKNRMISANEQISVVSVQDSGAKALNEHFLQSKTPQELKVTIQYSSIFNEKWQFEWSNIGFIPKNEKID